MSDTDVEVSVQTTFQTALGPLTASLPFCNSFADLAFSAPPSQGYLRHTHEQTIISSIEEGRRATTSDFYRNLDSQMRKDWERQKEKLFEELGRHQASGSTQSFEATPRRKGAGGGYDRGVRCC